jgi:hypothetical protein
MNITDYTSGPWEAKDQWGYIKIHSKDEGVCAVHGLGVNSQANARLIAAAPLLLEALRFLLADYVAINGEGLTQSPVPIGIAMAAIAQAEGKA